MSFKPQLTAHTLHVNRATAPARYGLAFVMAASLLCVSMSSKAQAQSAPKGPDPTFGVNGRVTTDFSGQADYANSIILQPDGKIVLAGKSGGDFALARYNTDGSLDDGTASDSTPADSFGTGGKVTTDFLGFADEATKVILQPDGKIIAAGYASDSAQNGGMRFALARYNVDGSPDDRTAQDSTPNDSFGAGGKVISDFSSEKGARDVVLQPDGKIVVVGSINGDFALARYNPDGNLDNGFGVGGKVVTDLFGVYEIANAILLQPDGKLVAAGLTNDYELPPYNGNDFALARYNVNGSLDDGSASDSTPNDSFGTGGRVSTDLLGADDRINDIALQPDGKIVAVGFAYPFCCAGVEYALARYNRDGSLDDGTAQDLTPNDSFGGIGFVAYRGGTDSELNAIAVQPNGKLVVVGFTSSYYPFVVHRLTAKGDLDPDFEGGADFGYSSAMAVAVQPDGKILAAGFAASVNNADFALARFYSDPVSPAINSLSLKSSAIPDSSNLVGTIKINFPAPATGLVVDLSTTNAGASVPAKVRIPAGSTTANFNIKTTPTLNSQSGNLIARIGKSIKSVSLVVQPLGVASLSFNAPSVEGPGPATGVVKLNGPAPAGGIVVQLTSRNPGIAAPVASSIVIPGGSRVKSFTVRAADVPSARTATITATANGISKSALLTVQ